MEDFLPPLSPAQKTIVEEEWLPHINALHSYAYHYTFDEEKADDLVQETYLKAMKAIHTYVIGSNAKAWLFTILRNSYINAYHKSKNEGKKIPLEDYLVGHDNDEVSPAELIQVDTGMLELLMGDEVNAALKRLPASLREAVLLCDVEGFAYQEMADLLNIPIGTVRSRISRGRNQLKEYLQEYATQRGIKPPPTD